MVRCVRGKWSKVEYQVDYRIEVDGIYLWRLVQDETRIGVSHSLDSQTASAPQMNCISILLIATYVHSFHLENSIRDAMSSRSSFLAAA